MVELEFAKKWIAGTEIDDAARIALEREKTGQSSIINYLGEFITDSKKVNETTEVYLSLIKYIKEHKLKSAIAIRPTQLGLLLGTEVCIANYEKIVKTAAKNKVFVWMDTENFDTVQNSIEVYFSQLGKYDNTGIGVQAKMKRTARDIKKLVSENAAIRLTHGFYPEVEGETYKEDKEVQKAYLDHMNYLFDNSKDFTITSDDKKIVGKALELQRKRSKKAKFSTVFGMAPNLSYKLAKDRQDVSIYVPFGTDWLGYLMRRLREEGNLTYFNKALLK